MNAKEPETTNPAVGLIDTHTHLESFAHRGVLPETLARARESGVDAMVTIGTSPEDWELYRQLARENGGFVHFSVGLHPCAVDVNWQTALSSVEDFWIAPSGETSGDAVRPVALGEIGLDRFHLPNTD